MSKKTTKKAEKRVIVIGGKEIDIVREDGRYWYTEDSQFRKLGGYEVKTVAKENKTERGED